MCGVGVVLIALRLEDLPTADVLMLILCYIHVECSGGGSDIIPLFCFLTVDECDQNELVLS